MDEKDEKIRCLAKESEKSIIENYKLRKQLNVKSYSTDSMQRNDK